MTRRQYLIAYFMISLNVMIAQKPIQHVISSAGSSNIQNDIILDWTIGELAVGTFSFSDHVFTEGFHQPFLFVDEITDKDDLSTNERLNISVWPNPTTSYLHIKLDSGLNENGLISLRTLEGRSLQSKSVNFSSESFEVSMGLYPAGIYLLSIISGRGTILKTFRIIKIQ